MTFGKDIKRIDTSCSRFVDRPDMEISPVVLIVGKPVATTSESHRGNWINFGNKKPPRELLMIIALPLTSVPRRCDDERAFKLNFNVRVRDSSDKARMRTPLSLELVLNCWNYFYCRTPLILFSDLFFF